MSRPLAFLVSGVVICAVVGGAILFFIWRNAPSVPSPEAPLTESAATPVWNGEETAREVAMRAAAAWQADAMLATIQSVDTSDTADRADAWQFTFIASGASGKGYVVRVADGRVTEAVEIDYVASGSALPSSFLTADEAVAAVRKLPGYEDVDVLGVEAVYGASNAIWYWGVKTSRGTVSIEATKK